MRTIEQQARAMSKAERMAYLTERGWIRLRGSRRAQSWLSPDAVRSNGQTFDPPYSLAAAIRKALRS